MTAIRTLPLHLDPIRGEALDSWLAALAHRSHTAWADMLTAAGLGTAGPAVARGSWLLQIDGHHLEELAAAVGIDTAVITSMTLSRYDGTALDIGRNPIHRTRRFPWGNVGRSRYCRTVWPKPGDGGSWRGGSVGRSSACSTSVYSSTAVPAVAGPPGGDSCPVRLCRSQDGAPSRSPKPAAGHPRDATPSCHLRRQFCFPPITASWQPSAPSMPYLNRALLEGFQSPSRDGPRHPVSHTVGPARLAQRHTVAAGQVRHGVAGDAVNLADALQPQLLPLVQLDQLSARDSGYPRGAHVGIEC